MTGFTLVLIALYSALWFCLAAKVVGKWHLNTRHLKWAAAMVVLLHTGLAMFSTTSSGSLDLSFFKIAILLFAIINLLLIISSIKKPVLSLLVVLIPLSIMALIAHAAYAIDNANPIDLSAGIATHILSSILAYSLLTIATIQSLLYTYQEYQLKHHSAGKILRILPPLQTMDQLLFNVIWAGFILLLLSIVSGAIFIDDIFAQQLTHKTVFSLLSIVIYGILLWGRHQFGWRGNNATKWVLAGFCLLMLAYFGTKFVIELLLQSHAGN